MNRNSVIASVLFLVGCASLRGEENVRTEFVSQCRLSSNEITSIVNLAHACGVSNVAKVRTYYLPPTTHCGIAVTGTEKIDGRRVSYMTVSVERQSWGDKLDRNPKFVLKAAGDFWVHSGGLQTNNLTTFTVRGQDLRVRLDEGFPLDFAEKILTAFAAGEVSYPDDATRGKLWKVDLAEPHALGWTSKKDAFRISFSSGPYATYTVVFVIRNGGITVLDVSTIVS
jgi:hypothetical protein